ncbi:MAG: hypothetical protein KDJ88_01005 [Bauldia sp.]|nr:hypothetical protein [Bauldia sp.]
MPAAAFAADLGTPEPMAGMYSYMADAALFRDCASGERYPVAFEGDNRALEAGYLAVAPGPGAEVLVKIEGRIEERPAMEGDGVEISVIPDHFIGAYPDKTCDSM